MRPLTRGLDRLGLIFLIQGQSNVHGSEKARKNTHLPLLSDSLVEGVLGVRSTKQGLDTEQDCANLKGRRPVVLQHIQADATESVDVWVIDAGQESYPRGTHRVVVREEKLEVELAT